MIRWLGLAMVNLHTNLKSLHVLTHYEDIKAT